MITIGELCEFADEALARGDIIVAELLHRITAERLNAAVHLEGAYPRRWASTVPIPAGTVFRADSPHCEIRWRRELDGCRALPPSGSGRVYSLAIIDRAWSVGGVEFVEIFPPTITADPFSVKATARQPI